MKPIKLQASTLKAIRDRLKLNDLNDVLTKDFPDRLKQQKVDREKASVFAAKYRGSVRLRSNRYLSEEESEERRNHILNIELP